MADSYEMMYILRPDLSEEQVQQEVTKYKDFLADYNTQNLEVKILGKRRLAYPIKKHLDGVYVQMNYEGDGKQVAPIERAMRLSDEVIRYLTLKIDHPSPVIPSVSEPTEKVVAAPAPIQGNPAVEAETAGAEE
jgi:small subunit ribosomal protein S6